MRHRLIFSLILWLGVLTIGLAQQPAKVYPEFITIPDSNALLVKTDLFKRVYNLKKADELRLLRTETDKMGMKHERFQQYYKNVPVDGAIVTVHTAKTGRVTMMNGFFVGMPEFNTDPEVSKTQALTTALAHVGADKYLWDDPKGAQSGYKKPEGVLVIVVNPPDGLIPRLAYKFAILTADLSYGADIFIDAHTGVYFKENALIIQTDVPASGNSYYNGLVHFTADSYSGGFRLRESSRGGGIITRDLYGNDITSTNANAWSDPVGVQAHWVLEQVYDYYHNVHGRNSYDDAGGQILVYVDHAPGVCNAGWNLSSHFIYLGYGDGVNCFPLVTPDVIGHEFTHGVTQFSAGLDYCKESGALNESFSDIFGEAVERYINGANDWLAADQIGPGGSGGAFRSLRDPNLRGDPDTYRGLNWEDVSSACTCTKWTDYCGVHTNSGVQNKWFFILTEGESGMNDRGDVYCVNGIGFDRAANIAYRNLSVYLSTYSTFASARTGAIQAARDLFGTGSEEEIAVTNAWFAVGVGGPYHLPPKITCPANSEHDNDPNLCSAVVTYPAPVAEANCPVVTQLTGLPSGSVFPVGVTTNTFRITDASGGSFSMCAFTVTVKDVDPPSIMCPGNISVPNDPGVCGAKVTYPASTAHDNCTPFSVVCSPPSGTIFPVGVTLVTCTATDLSGNTATCRFSVKVRDEEPPAITCPKDITNHPCETSTDPLVTGEPTTSDNCAVRMVAYNDAITPGICPENFTINRRWQVVDIYSNTQECKQTIIVKDEAPPVVTCPPNITVVCDISPDSTGRPKVTDNCDPHPHYTYSDASTGDCSWLCTIDRTWTGKDNCGNVASCKQTIVKNPLPLLDAALSMDMDGDGVTDTLVVGVSNSTLAIPPGRGICLQKWLPSKGTKPAGLKFEKAVAGINCRPGTNPVEANGTLTNPLLAEALYLNVMVRLDPALGKAKLSTQSCTMAPVIIHYLAKDPDINELLRFTNQVLGNVAGQPHMNELLFILKCINDPLHLCGQQMTPQPVF